MADDHHRAAVAERAARAGGGLARESFGEHLEVETKADPTDLVTAVDRRAQEQVVATIRREFPSDAFVLEESVGAFAEGGDGADGPRSVASIPETGGVWVVDPIDGTSNFVRGLETWTTSVAALVDGTAVGSASVLPAVDDAYAAGPESVTHNGSPIEVSERTDPRTFAVAAVGTWDRSSGRPFRDLASEITERFGHLRRLGSFQATLAHVAAGGLEAAIAPVPTEAWDTVAGVHMIRRAGGTVTDAEGGRWEPGADALVASNDRAHDALLETARRVRDR